jgi:hypothetical protein
VGAAAGVGPAGTSEQAQAAAQEALAGVPVGPLVEGAACAMWSAAMAAARADRRGPAVGPAEVEALTELTRVLYTHPYRFGVALHAALGAGAALCASRECAQMIADQPVAADTVDVSTHLAAAAGATSAEAKASPCRTVFPMQMALWELALAFFDPTTTHQEDGGIPLHTPAASTASGCELTGDERNEAVGDSGRTLCDDCVHGGGLHHGIGDIAHVSAAAMLAALAAHALAPTGEGSLSGPFRDKLNQNGGFAAAMMAMRLRLRGAPGTMEDDTEEGGAATIMHLAAAGGGGGVSGGAIAGAGDVDALVAALARPRARPEVLQHLVAAAWLLARDPHTRARLLMSTSSVPGRGSGAREDVEHGNGSEAGRNDCLAVLTRLLSTWLPVAATSAAATSTETVRIMQGGSVHAGGITRAAAAALAIVRYTLAALWLLLCDDDTGGGDDIEGFGDRQWRRMVTPPPLLCGLLVEALILDDGDMGDEGGGQGGPGGSTSDENKGSGGGTRRWERRHRGSDGGGLQSQPTLLRTLSDDGDAIRQLAAGLCWNVAASDPALEASLGAAGLAAALQATVLHRGFPPSLRRVAAGAMSVLGPQSLEPVGGGGGLARCLAVLATLPPDPMDVHEVVPCADGKTSGAQGHVKGGAATRHSVRAVLSDAAASFDFEEPLGPPSSPPPDTVSFVGRPQSGRRRECIPPQQGGPGHRPPAPSPTGSSTRMVPRGANPQPRRRQSNDFGGGSGSEAQGEEKHRERERKGEKEAVKPTSPGATPRRSKSAGGGAAAAKAVARARRATAGADPSHASSRTDIGGHERTRADIDGHSPAIDHHPERQRNAAVGVAASLAVVNVTVTVTARATQRVSPIAPPTIAPSPRPPSAVAEALHPTSPLLQPPSRPTTLAAVHAERLPAAPSVFRLACPLTAVFPMHVNNAQRPAPEPPTPPTLAWSTGTVRAPLGPYVALSVPPPRFVLRETTLTEVIATGREDGTRGVGSQMLSS